MGEIINVKDIIERKKVGLKDRIESLKNKGVNPKLVVIHANQDEASNVYISKKRKMCEELGILEEEYDFNEDVTQKEMLTLIEKLNNDESIHGILVQLPIYNHLDTTGILEAISPKKDVDGFHPINIGKIMQGVGGVAPCTPKGVMTILEELGVDIEGKNATVIGRSIIVGRPMGALLLNKGATVTTCHSKTTNLIKHTENADILVVAVGRPHLVTKDMVKEGAIVIDVGINRVDGVLIGDVDTKNVAEKVKYITPVPGGVGLTTVYTLMENVVELAEKTC